MRTENDLRTAFAAKAEEAPSADAVRRAAALRYADHRATRRWALSMATLTAVIVLVGAGVLAVLRSSNGVSGSSNAGGGGAVDGPVRPSQARTAASAGRSTPAPACHPTQLRLSLAWRQAATGLVGTVTAVNTGHAACDLSVAPEIRPLSVDGTALSVRTVPSVGHRASPPPLPPGGRASAAVSWPAWCGAPAGHLARIGWNGQVAQIRVIGPVTTPACTPGASTQISSARFAQS